MSINSYILQSKTQIASKCGVRGKKLYKRINIILYKLDKILISRA